jgi:DNA-binding HxlR family transcriptional regulator
MPIIWRLRDNSRRYGELKRSFTKVTHKMLTQQLRELERDEIILRKVYPEVPPKVEYSLTYLGKSILPVIEMLIEWGKEYKSVFE